LKAQASVFTLAGDKQRVAFAGKRKSSPGRVDFRETVP
jgi:hypothetical protein